MREDVLSWSRRVKFYQNLFLSHYWFISKYSFDKLFAIRGCFSYFKGFLVI